MLVLLHILVILVISFNHSVIVLILCLIFATLSILLQDVRFANEALTRLQGFVLLSSERGGIRIEFAKNKMGEVRLLCKLIVKPLSTVA